MNAVDLSDFSSIDRKVLRGFCYRYTKNWDAAEDLLQSTLLKALRSNFNGGCSKRTWLCFIARTQYLMQRRAQESRFDLHHAQPLDTVQVAAYIESPLADLVRERGREQVRRAVASLSEPYRLAITVFWLKERSEKETAAELGITKSALKARLHRGKAMLRQRLMN